MKIFKKVLLFINCLFCIFLLFTMNQKVLSQGKSTNIGVGSLSYNLDDVIAGDNGLLEYPRKYSIFTNQSCVRGEGFIIAAKNFRSRAYYEDGYPNAQKPNNGWIVSDTYKTFNSYVIDGTPTINLDPARIVVPVQGAFKKFWKYNPTQRIVNNEDFSSSSWNASVEEINSSIPTEQMGVTVCRTAMGITVTERVYVFGNPAYDDFALVEYVFKYTGDTPNVDNSGNPIVYSDPIQDCYLGVKYFPIISDSRVVPNSGGWLENTDDWVEYTHSNNGDLLRVMYGWDGDAGANTEDDEGDPLVSSSGVFLSPQYPGMAVLYVSKDPNNSENDLNQPHLSYVSWGAISSRNTLTSGPQGPGMDEVYSILENGGELLDALDWDQWNSAQTDNWLRDAQNDPTKHYSQIGTLAFGPYNFNSVGDSIRILLCHTVGSISWEDAVHLGQQWKDGAITSTEKNQVLRSGRNKLFAKIKDVKELFKTSGGDYDYQVETIAQKIESPPPWPGRVELSPATGGNQIDWTPVPEAIAYRVYRRLQPDFHIETPGTITYPMVFQTGGEDPGAGIEYAANLVTSWKDENVVPTQFYWYFITAVNSAGVESSHFVTRTNPISSDPTRGGVTPFEKPPVTLDSLFVVPNPYHVKSVRLYDRVLDYIDFVGLPASCRIRIFTQSGDLIATINHELTFPPSSKESWEMRTSTNQTIASGLYVYVVDRCRDYTEEPINLTKVGKFVVIR